MKLAKKMLVSVLALAMVAALALTAFAAAPTLTSTVSAAEVGKEVTVTVSAKNMVGTETASIFFQFDPEALEFVSSKNAASGAMVATDLVKDEAKNTVSYALAYTDAAEADTDLVVMTFKVLKAGDTTITGKVTEWTGIEAPTDVTVTVKATEPTTAAPTTVAPTTAAPATEPTSATTPATTGKEIAQTGEAGIAAIAGVMALAAVAFVATRKKDEE